MNSKIIILLLVVSVVLLSCSSCKSENSETGKKVESFSLVDSLTFSGKITKVGNEPFTKLGLILNESTIYILECDENIANELNGLQGNNVKIFANNKIEDEMGTKLLVKKYEIIK